MSNQIQEKLLSVFSEAFQVKRVEKEMATIRESREKYGYDCKMSFTRGQSVSFAVEYLKPALKKLKVSESQSSLEVKIILRKNYPAEPPLLHCLSDNMIDVNILPFRNYAGVVVPEWSVKFTVMDLIKGFLDVVLRQQKGELGVYEQGESFEIEKVYSWSFLQTFPVTIVKKTQTSAGLLLINCQSELIFLQQSEQSSSNHVTRDLVPVRDLLSIFKFKGNSKRLLLEIRSDGVKKGILIDTEDKENIANSVIDLIKLSSASKNQASKTEQESDASSSDDDFENDFGNEQQENAVQDEDPLITSESSSRKIDIESIKEAIVYYESLVSENMNSENISSLVELLKKAIEYYSALGSEEFHVYLEKLKTLMGSEEAQVMLDSAEAKRKEDEARMGSGLESGGNSKAAEYTSIIDMC